MKELLTASGIVEHMSSNGIKFEIIGKEDAIEFLKSKNYYMKCAAYRGNYTKKESPSGDLRYVNLDFAYLVELASIDEELRRVILEMTLEIEHFLKVQFLNDIENNPNEDGYHIIQKFVSKDEDLYRLKVLGKLRSSSYCKGLYEKYYPYFPAWVYVELISFSQLNALLNTYAVLYRTRETICDYKLLNSVRDLRNATAHNNCLINKLRPGDNMPAGHVSNWIKNLATDDGKRLDGFSNDAIKKKLKNKFIYDFVCLLRLYFNIIPKDAKESRYKELDSLFSNRFLEHKDWFVGNKGNYTITSAYTFLKKVLDKSGGVC